MKKWLALIIILCLTIVVGCGNKTTPNTTTAAPTSGQTTNQTIEQLQHVENFTPQALHHIFEGEINKRNQVVGYHYEGISTAKAKVEEGSRSTADKHGVYNGKVYIGKQLKEGNNGYSTFYPREWTAQQVVDAINYAWAHKEQKTQAQYVGKTKEGITITFYTDDKTGKIATAYPNKEK